MVYAEHCKSDGFVIEINFVVTIKRALKFTKIGEKNWDFRYHQRQLKETPTLKNFLWKVTVTKVYNISTVKLVNMSPQKIVGACFDAVNKFYRWEKKKLIF